MEGVWEAIGGIAIVLVLMAFGLGYKLGHDEGMEDGWKLRGMIERKGE